MDASDLLRNSLLQLSKQEKIRDVIEKAPVSRSVVRRFVPGTDNAAVVGAATEIGASGRGVDFFKSYVSNPAQYGNNVMISYGYLGDENLTKIATFLDASKGTGG